MIAGWVVLTGHDDVNLAVRAIKSGAEVYLVKPAKMEKIDEIIQGCLASAQLEKSRLQTKQSWIGASTKTGNHSPDPSLPELIVTL